MDVGCELVLISASGYGYGTLVTVDSSGDGGYGSTFSDVISSSTTIDNGRYSYAFVVTIPANEINLRFYMATIGFEYLT